VFGCTANAETFDSDPKEGLYYEREHSEKGKVWDASRSTFNEIGRDQYNQHSCYNTFIVHHHNYFYSRETLDQESIHQLLLMVVNPPVS